MTVKIDYDSLVRVHF